MYSNLTKTKVDKFDENSETFKIKNSERYKDSDQNYETFKNDRLKVKSDRLKSCRSQGGRDGFYRHPVWKGLN